MTTRVMALAAITATAASSVSAAGLDRSFQSISPIFNESGTLSFSHAQVNPSVTGSDSTGASYDVGESYSNTTLAYTHDLNDKFTLGFIIDQPFGADVLYNGDGTTTNLGGTAADLSSEAFTLLGKYKLNDRVSLIGGLKAQRVNKTTVNLNGIAYQNAISASGAAQFLNATNPGVVAGTVAPITTTEVAAALTAAAGGDLSLAGAIEATYGTGSFTTLQTAFGTNSASFVGDGGYSYEQGAETEYGYVIGAAYEIPDIALRLAVTYHSEIDYTASSVETLLGNTVVGTTDFVTPESLNIEFQTGIAADTLLLASYRWTAFEDVDVVPTGLSSDLVNLDNGQRFTLGVGRRFNEEWSGSAILSYEPTGDDNLVSPLGPTDGLFGISVGARYVTDQLEISGGINYSWLGDAEAEVGGVSQASFRDSYSVAVGLNVKFTF